MPIIDVAYLFKVAWFSNDPLAVNAVRIATLLLAANALAVISVVNGFVLTTPAIMVMDISGVCALPFSAGRDASISIGSLNVMGSSRVYSPDALVVVVTVWLSVSRMVTVALASGAPAAATPFNNICIGIEIEVEDPLSVCGADVPV
ncbi:MAG: hypothetical protein Q9M26_08225 [Mariprofundales bacterium]|nr:hypothetical protein [Mariprofundales bacterium]